MLRAIRPIQSILIMVFFLSIGLLIDLDFIYQNLALILLVLAVIVIAKTAFNIGFLHLAGQPWAHAVIAGILLAQIGEFSFVLGQTGLEHGLVTPEEGSLIVAVTALSLLISPVWLFTARRLMRITIIGVTSGREMIRLFFGRISPIIFRMGRAWTNYETLADSHPQRAVPDEEEGDAPPPPDEDTRGSDAPEEAPAAAGAPVKAEEEGRA